MNGEFIDQLITDHASIASRTRLLHERYLGSKEGVPIKTRELPDRMKVNNKIANDFMGEIIDTKTGFFAGIPINYELDKMRYENKQTSVLKKIYDTLRNNTTVSSQDYELHTDFLTDFINRNNMNDLDSELSKLVSICGHAGRKIYIDTDGFERVVNLKPYETIFLVDGQKEVRYALRYFKQMNDEGVMVTKAEFYDASGTTYFVENVDNKNSDDKYILDMEEAINPLEHTFDYTPIILFENNEEQQGDVEKVLDLVDNYNEIMSNNSNELTSFMLSYMFFKGQEPDAEVMKQVQQTGAFALEEGSEVGFITKNLDPAFNNAFLDRTEDNIQRFAKHVNFMDSEFANAASGISLQYKLQALTNKCITLETKFKSGLRFMFKVLSSSWTKRRINIDYLNVFFTFKRNMPTDYLYEADVTMKLKGSISERTRLSLLSFIDDVDYELQQMKEDAEASMSSFTDPNADVDEEFNTGNLEEDADEQAAV